MQTGHRQGGFQFPIVTKKEHQSQPQDSSGETFFSYQKLQVGSELHVYCSVAGVWGVISVTQVTE